MAGSHSGVDITGERLARDLQSLMNVLLLLDTVGDIDAEDS